MKQLPWYLFSGVWLGWLLCVAGAALAVYLWRRRRLRLRPESPPRPVKVGVVAALGFGLCFGLLWAISDYARRASNEGYDASRQCHPEESWSGWLFLSTLSAPAQQQAISNYEMSLATHCEQTQARVEAWVALQEAQDQCFSAAERLLQLGRPKEALASAERCSDVTSQRYTAYAHASLGDFARAADILRALAPEPFYAEGEIEIDLLAGDVALAQSRIKAQLAWLEQSQRGSQASADETRKRRGYQCLSDALALRAKDNSARARLEEAIKEERADPSTYAFPCRLLLADQLSGQERLTLIAAQSPGEVAGEQGLKPQTITERRLCLLALEADPETPCPSALFSKPATNFFRSDSFDPEIGLVYAVLTSLEAKELSPSASLLQARLRLEAGLFETLMNHQEKARALISQAEKASLSGEDVTLTESVAEAKILYALRFGEDARADLAALPTQSLSQPTLALFADLKAGRAPSPDNDELNRVAGRDSLSIQALQELFGYYTAKDGAALASWLVKHRLFDAVMLMLALPALDETGKEAMRGWLRWQRNSFTLEHHFRANLKSELPLNAQEVVLWGILGDDAEAQLHREISERFYQAYLNRALTLPLSLLSGASF